MKIKDLVPGKEVDVLEAKVLLYRMFTQIDTRYNKTLVVREYHLSDDTGETTLTTFGKDLAKNPEDRIIIRRAWCKNDKFWGNCLTLGKWGTVE